MGRNQFLPPFIERSEREVSYVISGRNAEFLRRAVQGVSDPPHIIRTTPRVPANNFGVRVTHERSQFHGAGVVNVQEKESLFRKFSRPGVRDLIACGMTSPNL